MMISMYDANNNNKHIRNKKFEL